MANEVRIVLNDDGVRDLLNSSGVQAFLEREGHKVASAAASGGGTYEVEVETAVVRARCKVRAADQAARRAESENQALSRAGYANGGQPGRG